TGNEQSGYMEVVLKSVEQYSPDLVSKTKHLTHGMVKLAGGVKMSSRLGNVLTANAVLDATKEANNDHGDDDYVTIGAIKYAFLKQSIGGDIIYDPAESVSLEGNSGPYLQYAYARAMGILDKAGESSFDLKSADNFTDFERSLLRKVGEYSEVIELATSELRPHHVAGYIYDLAQNFNRFYENSRVVGDERQDLRLSLVRLYASKLESGLKLLGIETLNKM
ncbi:MAG TPA: DALR anticodon-binding domain-containing protein, partial [Candidatus Saccharimonadales bacterium]